MENYFLSFIGIGHDYEVYAPSPWLGNQQAKKLSKFSHIAYKKWRIYLKIKFKWSILQMQLDKVDLTFELWEKHRDVVCNKYFSQVFTLDRLFYDHHLGFDPLIKTILFRLLPKFSLSSPPPFSSPSSSPPLSFNKLWLYN